MATITFNLQVVNPVAASQNDLTRQNINWVGPNGEVYLSVVPGGSLYGERESIPDVMPGTNGINTIKFVVDDSHARGKLQVVYFVSQTAPYANGMASPVFTVEDGATYTWNMQANTIGGSGDSPFDMLGDNSMLIVIGLVAVVGGWFYLQSGK